MVNTIAFVSGSSFWECFFDKRDLIETHPDHGVLLG